MGIISVGLDLLQYPTQLSQILETLIEIEFELYTLAGSASCYPPHIPEIYFLKNLIFFLHFYFF